VLSLGHVGDVDVVLAERPPRVDRHQRGARPPIQKVLGDKPVTGRDLRAPSRGEASG
jgi:hypothetical protein